MKYFSKMKKQIVALSLALSLGLVLGASTGPVYGSPTVSVSPSGDVTQAAISKLKLRGVTWEDLAILVIMAFGVADSAIAAAYPSNALDR